MPDTDQLDPRDIFRQLIERAIAESDPRRFRQMLDDIGVLLGVPRHRPEPEPLASEQPAAPPVAVALRQPAETDVFDIFSGVPGQMATWLESCTGIEAARRRLQELAVLEPNDYFVFHTPSRSVISRIAKDSLRRNLDTQAKTAS